MKINEFLTEINKIGIIPSEKQLQQLEIYFNELVNENKKYNLTAITEKEQVYLKHFYDSLCLVKTKLIKNNIALCDIGTGAGFPGIVIAIFFPSINVTLIESNSKKCGFLIKIIKKLKLNNVNVINDRVELVCKNHKEQFDIVTCRAVAKLNILLEISSQLIKMGGYFIPLKSSLEEELKLSNDIFSKLGVEYKNCISYALPKEQSIRNIPIFKKIKHTENIYPREFRKIKKQPL